MFEPGLKYCPLCKDEYLAHVVRCAECGVELKSGEELLADEQLRQQRLDATGLAISDQEQTVVVHTGPMADLKRLRELFAAERIGARIVGDDASCNKGCCPSRYYLEIRPDDLAEARRIIEREYLRMTGLAAEELAGEHTVFDPEAAMVVCPACGHRFTPTEASCPDCGLCFG